MPIRGRGGVHRQLYDPNNPNTKPQPPSPQQLHFHDPSEPQYPKSPQEQFQAIPNYFQGEQAKQYFDQIYAEYGPGGTFGSMFQGYGVDGLGNEAYYQR